MSLDELYDTYEKNISKELFDKIEIELKKDEKAYFYLKDGTKSEDDYLKLMRMTSDTISILNNNSKEWSVPPKVLLDAVKLTLRKGDILKPSEYSILSGKSKALGTPLHLLISLLEVSEYKNNSVVGNKIPHVKFGECQIKGIGARENSIEVETDNDGIKKLSMQYIPLTEDQFAELTN